METSYEINNFSSTSNSNFSCEDQLHLLLALKNFFVFDGERRKVRHSYFKILYALYIFTKRCFQRGDKEVFPTIKTLSQMTGCGKTSISEFINCKFFKNFGHVYQRRLPNGKNSSNCYVLSKWVCWWFNFFEKHGYMKGFKTDYEKWSKSFENRLRKGLLKRALEHDNFREFCSQLLNSNYIEQKRLMNNLSTKKSLKTDAVKPLIPDAIKPKGFFYKSSKEGFRRTSKENPHSLLPKMEKTERILIDEFKIGEIDVHFLMNNTRPSSLQIAINNFRSHTSTGWKPRSNVAYFTSLLSKKPHEKNSYRRKL